MCVCVLGESVKNGMVLKFIWKNKWYIRQENYEKRAYVEEFGLLHIKTYCENFYWSIFIF